MSAINSISSMPELLAYCAMYLIGEAEAKKIVKNDSDKPSWNKLYTAIGNTVTDYCKNNDEEPPYAVTDIIWKCAQILESENS